MTLRRFSLAIVFLIGAAVIPALAQGPIQERINFTVDAPFELKGTNVVLPAGNYALFQIDRNDRNLFALYRGSDMMHTPIAMLKTVRIYYSLGKLPGKTKMLMEPNEASQNCPVLEGWIVPGDFGWRVIGATTRSEALSVRR